MHVIDLRRTAGALALVAVLVTGCSTTEQEVRTQIEVLAANDIGSDNWQGAVDALTSIGRPAARQLIILLDPAQYRGVNYREFRDEIERTRTGAATVLGNIRHKAASASMDDRIAVAYRRSERLAALRAVGELGHTEAAATLLTAQLADKDPEIRLLAAMALVKLGDDTAQDTVLSAVRGADDALAQLAIAELQSANYRGVPLLMDLADDDAHADRLRQARDAIRGQLVAQLGADDPETRRESAAALGAIGDAGSAEALAALLSDPSNLVRFHAASSLTRLGDTRGPEFLFSALDNDDAILRLNAIKSLVRVQEQSGGTERRLRASLTAESPRLRSGAAQILGQAGVTSATAALIELTTDSVAEVRWNAAIALGHLGAAAGRPALERLTDDDNETVAYYAQWALGRLGAG